MSLERRPGFEAYVGRSSLAEHREMLASSRYAYFLGLDGAGAAVAFAILRDLDEPHGNLYLKRIAVDGRAGAPATRFLALLIDWAFANRGAQVLSRLL